MAKKTASATALNTRPPTGSLGAGLLNKLTKKFSEMDGVSMDSLPPRYWFSAGNAALNKIISNDYNKGIPQGRVTGIAGPSGSGKSFISTNCMVGAQADDGFVFVIDTENALDDGFVGAVGVDVTQNYMYTSAITISQVSQLVSEFVKGYKSDYGTAEDAPKVLIVIDSLDMLLTDTELENYEKGDTKGDQGQRAKQLKAMLRTFVQDIRDVNISIIVTTQVYKATAQQILEGEGTWIINGAVRYALSQLILCTRLKLKDKDTKKVEGIRMKCEAFKTRFSKPFQSVTIEVPYETGMDFYNGFQDILESAGQVARSGSWYNLVDTEIKWQSKNFNDVADEVLAIIVDREKQGELRLDLKLGADEEVTLEG